jgi:ribosomal protein S2
MYAEQSQLFIFSDGPKTEKDESKVKEVRKYLKTIKGFKNIEIIERDKNWELVNNIIDAVTKIVNKHGRIIVLWTPWKRARKYHKKISEKTQIYIDLTKE